jgi:sulfur carrier protein ThiS
MPEVKICVKTQVYITSDEQTTRKEHDLTVNAGFSSSQVAFTVNGEPVARRRRHAANTATVTAAGRRSGSPAVLGLGISRGGRRSNETTTNSTLANTTAANATAAAAAAAEAAAAANSLMEDDPELVCRAM